MPAIDLNQCKVSVTSSKHEEFPDAVSYVNVKVRRPGCKDPVAVLITYLIDRDRFPYKEFHPMMDHISEELGTFSSRIFDVDGNLRGKFIDHEYHRGTGCWGRELDCGMLVYIDYMRVEKEYRRKGLASLALQALITSKYVRAKDFVVTLPCYLTPDVNSDEERVKQLDISRAFFYKHGFRRIGRTEFTAFTPVPEHPSHLVEVSDDVPSDELIYQSKNSEDWSDEQEIDCSLDANGRFIRVVVDRKYAATWPLHNAIAAATDASTTSGIKDLILHSYSTQPASIHTQDREGYTLLHIAARELNYSAVETLLSLKATPSHTSPNETSNLVVLNQLTKRDNVLGSTPLELCEETLLHNREKFESLAQGVQVAMWPGYQERGLKVAYALRCLMGIDTGGAHNEGEYANLKRWGCTCGECAGGWLSGRMRFMLRSKSAFVYEALS
ncbi:hypothetical protein NM688_g8953 [Phlebia brevispora]|uniref:Uncharacterized protein n=1 Tax=Phlebia brevispora TaxID=194682 RepID=A0ACC1RMB7_9APHY|nr:hypothetical protein NM688_g8953 [Phlebia brevispora]